MKEKKKIGEFFGKNISIIKKDDRTIKKDKTLKELNDKFKKLTHLFKIKKSLNNPTFVTEVSFRD